MALFLEQNYFYCIAINFACFFFVFFFNALNVFSVILSILVVYCLSCHHMSMHCKTVKIY